MTATAIQLHDPPLRFALMIWSLQSYNVFSQNVHSILSTPRTFMTWTGLFYIRTVEKVNYIL